MFYLSSCYHRAFLNEEENDWGGRDNTHSDANEMKSVTKEIAKGGAIHS